MVVVMVVVMEEEEETISTLTKTEAWLSVNQTLCLTTHSLLIEHRLADASVVPENQHWRFDEETENPKKQLFQRFAQ